MESTGLIRWSIASRGYIFFSTTSAIQWRRSLIIGPWRFEIPISYDFNCLQIFAWHVRKLRRTEMNFDPPLDSILPFVKTVKVIFTSIVSQQWQSSSPWQSRGKSHMPNRNWKITKKINVRQTASVKLYQTEIWLWNICWQHSLRTWSEAEVILCHYIANYSPLCATLIN